MKVPQLKKKPELKSCHNITWEDNYSRIHQKNILEVIKDKNKLAIKFYQKAKKINPNNQQIDENIIICYIRLKNFKWVEKKILNLQNSIFQFSDF